MNNKYRLVYRSRTKSHFEKNKYANIYIQKRTKKQIGDSTGGKEASKPSKTTHKLNLQVDGRYYNRNTLN